MKRIHHPVALIFLAAFGVGCDNPVAPTGEESSIRSIPNAVASSASVNHFMVKFELPLSLTIPCIDEEVAIGDGVRHLLVHQVANDNGSLFRLHLNHSRITGIGSVTGNEYVGQFVLNQQSVSFTEKGQTQTLQQHIHGVSKGSSPNWIVSILLHLTLNANGELTAETEFLEAECRG